MKKQFLVLQVILLFFHSLLLAQNLPNYDPNIVIPGLGTRPINNSIPGSIITTTPPLTYSANPNVVPTLFNYKRIFHPQIPITDPNQINENANQLNYKWSTSYTDGFGRIIQETEKSKASFLKAIIQCYDYRPSAIKISYLPYSTGYNSFNDHFQLNPFQDQKAFYDNLYTDEQGTALSKTMNTSDPSTGRHSITALAPGKTNVGQNRGTETYNDLNSSSEIHKFYINSNSGWPVENGYYSAGQILKKILHNSDGAVVEEYYNKEGQLLCKRVLVADAQCGNTGDDPVSLSAPPVNTSNCPIRNVTYYIYNDLNKLAYIISPKAYNILAGSGFTFTTDIVENLCDYYLYDSYGRMIEKHVAGEIGREEFVYDRKDRVVLTKTPAAPWMFSIYDKLDRIVEIGDFNVSWLRPYLQSLLNDNSSYGTSDLLYYLKTDAGEGQYTNSLNQCDILTYTYYDGYSATNGIFNNPQMAFDWNEYSGNLVANSYAPTPARSDKTFGYVTAKKTRVLLPTATYNDPYLSSWVSTVYYYDDYGRVLQTKTQNHRNGIDINTTQYDFKGRVLVNILNQNNPRCSTKPNTKVVTNYGYEQYTFNLLNITEKIDNNPIRTIAHYTYDALGRVSSKVMGGTAEEQHYEYNIRNQLTAINKDYTEAYDASNPNISFGETIKYDRGFNNNYYCGNIAGILWRGAGNSTVKCYGFNYDYAGRLLQADFRELENVYTVSGTTISKSQQWLNRDMDYTEGEISYDFNSNIQALKRYGPTKSGSNIIPGLIDDLTLHYQANEVSNQLNNVSDAISPVGQITDYDFKDVSGTTEYSYDINGNLTGDNNKNISVIDNKAILNKPNYISLNNGDRISYVYDASGNRLEEIYSGATNKTVDYFGTITYENNNITQVNNAEGYAIYINNTFNYYFFAKDHLGNVRNVIDATNRQDNGYPGWRSNANVVKLGWELSNASTENQVAACIEPVRDFKPLSIGEGDVSCAMLDASNPDKRVGGLVMFKVMAGDSFTVSADCYGGTTNPDMGIIPDDQMMTSILSAATGPFGVTGGLESADGQILQSAFSVSNYMEAYTNIKNTQADPAKPQSFLNYILLDDNLNIVREESGVLQLGTAGEGGWGTVAYGNSSAPIAIGKSGYILVYASNQDTKVVAGWDNIRVEHYKGKVVEENHYYPFGVTVNIANNNPVSNRYLFETNRLEKNNNLNIYDFNARTYNPQLGSFWSLDPMEQYHSGYVFCGSNPISLTDRSGLESDYFSNFGAGSSFDAAIGALYGGMGVSGSRGGLGFTMSKEARADGYNALGKTVSWAIIVGAGMLTEGEMAAVETETRLAAEAGVEEEDFAIVTQGMTMEERQQAAYNIRKTMNEQFMPEAQIGQADQSAIIDKPSVTESNRVQSEISPTNTAGTTGNNIQSSIDMNSYYNTMSANTESSLASLDESANAAIHFNAAYTETQPIVPDMLYHYATSENIESILKSGFTFGEKRDLFYFTDDFGKGPFKAQLDLALSDANRNSLIGFKAKNFMDDFHAAPILIRPATGNLFNLPAGGGTEFIFNVEIPKNYLVPIK